MPFASFVVAVNCCVEPTDMLEARGFTATDATGTGVTVSVALPVLASLVAMMLAVPAEMAVTNPVGEIVATLGLSEDQATDRPVNSLLPASKVVAVA